MQYKLTVGGEDAFYRVNFKDQNNVFEELDLSKYEKLYDNFLNLIKKEQPNISTAISLVA